MDLSSCKLSERANEDVENKQYSKRDISVLIFNESKLRSVIITTTNKSTDMQSAAATKATKDISPCDSEASRDAEDEDIYVCIDDILAQIANELPNLTIQQLQQSFSSDILQIDNESTDIHSNYLYFIPLEIITGTLLIQSRACDSLAKKQKVMKLCKNLLLKNFSIENRQSENNQINQINPIADAEEKRIPSAVEAIEPVVKFDKESVISALKMILPSNIKSANNLTENMLVNLCKEIEEKKGDKFIAALKQMRGLIPSDIFDTSLKRLTQSGLPTAVANRIWNNRILWLLRMPADEIVKMHISDLRGRYHFHGLDIVEMRAVWSCLPAGWTGSSPKAIWKNDFRTKLIALSVAELTGALTGNEERNAVYNELQAEGKAYFDVNDEVDISEWHRKRTENTIILLEREQLLGSNAKSLRRADSWSSSSRSGDDSSPIPILYSPPLSLFQTVVDELSPIEAQSMAAACGELQSVSKIRVNTSPISLLLNSTAKSHSKRSCSNSKLLPGSSSGKKGSSGKKRRKANSILLGSSSASVSTTANKLQHVKSSSSSSSSSSDDTSPTLSPTVAVSASTAMSMSPNPTKLLSACKHGFTTPSAKIRNRLLAAVNALSASHSNNNNNAIITSTKQPQQQLQQQPQQQPQQQQQQQEEEEDVLTPIPLTTTTIGPINSGNRAKPVKRLNCRSESKSVTFSVAKSKPQLLYNFHNSASKQLHWENEIENATNSTNSALKCALNNCSNNMNQSMEAEQLFLDWFDQQEIGTEAEIDAGEDKENISAISRKRNSNSNSPLQILCVQTDRLQLNSQNKLSEKSKLKCISSSQKENNSLFNQSDKENNDNNSNCKQLLSTQLIPTNIVNDNTAGTNTTHSHSKRERVSALFSPTYSNGIRITPATTPVLTPTPTVSALNVIATDVDMQNKQQIRASSSKKQKKKTAAASDFNSNSNSNSNSSPTNSCVSNCNSVDERDRTNREWRIRSVLMQSAEASKSMLQLQLQDRDSDDDTDYYVDYSDTAPSSALASRNRMFRCSSSSSEELSSICSTSSDSPPIRNPTYAAANNTDSIAAAAASTTSVLSTTTVAADDTADLANQLLQRYYRIDSATTPYSTMVAATAIATGDRATATPILSATRNSNQITAIRNNNSNINNNVSARKRCVATMRTPTSQYYNNCYYSSALYRSPFPTSQRKQQLSSHRKAIAKTPNNNIGVDSDDESFDVSVRSSPSMVDISCCEGDSYEQNCDENEEEEEDINKEEYEIVQDKYEEIEISSSIPNIAAAAATAAVVVNECNHTNNRSSWRGIWNSFPLRLLGKPTATEKPITIKTANVAAEKPANVIVSRTSSINPEKAEDEIDALIDEEIANYIVPEELTPGSEEHSQFEDLLDIVESNCQNDILFEDSEAIDDIVNTSPSLSTTSAVGSVGSIDDWQLATALLLPSVSSNHTVINNNHNSSSCSRGTGGSNSVIDTPTPAISEVLDTLHYQYTPFDCASNTSSNSNATMATATAANTANTHTNAIATAVGTNEDGLIATAICNSKAVNYSPTLSTVKDFKLNSSNTLTLQKLFSCSTTQLKQEIEAEILIVSKEEANDLLMQVIEEIDLISQPLELLMFLIDTCNANPNIVDEFGATPLHRVFARPLLGQYLLAKGAEILLADQNGETVLQLCLEYEYSWLLPALDRLGKEKAYLENRNTAMQYIRHLLVFGGMASKVQTILSRGTIVISSTEALDILEECRARGEEAFANMQEPVETFELLEDLILR